MACRQYTLVLYNGIIVSNRVNNTVVFYINILKSIRKVFLKQAKSKNAGRGLGKYKTKYKPVKKF